MANPLNTVAFTKGFLDQANDEGMTDGEIEMMVQTLARNPDAGDVIKGSGGCRKVRVPGEARENPAAIGW